MFKYITSRPLWFNILVAIGIVFIVIVAFILLLSVITRHGKSSTVPYVVGKNINDVQKQLSGSGFETVIQDSVFYDSLPPGVVIKQVPDADAVVKVNRTVYVIINRFVPPNISMPNIVGYSLRNAQYTLESLGLKLGDTTSRVDFAKNTVLEMSVNGETIRPGDKVKLGTKIDLVIARGVAEEQINVPDLIGMTYAEALSVLREKGLEAIPIVSPGVRDTMNAYVYRQVPSAKTADGVNIRIRPGQMMDLFLQVEKPVIDTTITINPVQQNDYFPQYPEPQPQ
jgi:hypothetical protein